MDLDTVLTRLRTDPDAALDVAEVALLLARDEYPDLDVAGYLSEIDAMAHELKPALRGGLESRVAALCRYLFQDLGYSGNQENYYDPRNSYFNEVLDRRTGLPITLSALTMAVGARAGMEIAGVGLPGHFVARATAGKRAVFFDPFNGGRVLTREDCEKLVEQVTGESFAATPDSLRPLPLGPMVARHVEQPERGLLPRRRLPAGGAGRRTARATQPGRRASAPRPRRRPDPGRSAGEGDRSPRKVPRRRRNDRNREGGARPARPGPVQVAYWN